MTDEEKYLLQQEMQRQHILNAGGLGLPMPNNAQMPPLKPAFGGGGGMLGVVQAQKQNEIPFKEYINSPNASPEVLNYMARQKIGRDNIRIMPDGSVAMGMGKGTRPDDSKVVMVGRDNKGRPSKVFTPTPIPPPQSAQIPYRRTPSRWDMIKEKMFAGEDQQGLFGKAGANRGSMGLGGYFNDLFNDPARMAMLSGGLTAMDQNSYYDKEGFQSPWTGLRSGLGGAQAGYKSVIDRRKAEAETAKLRADQIASENQGRFKNISSETEAGVIDQRYLASQISFYEKQGKTGKESRELAGQDAFVKMLDKDNLKKKDRATIEFEYQEGYGQLDHIDEMLKLASNSLNTGAAGWGKRVWDSARGVFSYSGENTEATRLVEGINHLVSQNWKELVGGGQLSQGDLRFIAKVVRNPDSIFTTSFSVKQSLDRLRKIVSRQQRSRAKSLGVDYKEAIKEIGSPSHASNYGKKYNY
jgi:DNA-binding ferritin-like protein (Dps family)